MSQNDLIRVLEEDVKRESEEILKEAEEEARRIVDEALRKAAKIKDKRLGELKSELEGRRAAEVNRAHIRSRALVVEVKSSLIDEVIDRAVEVLEDMSGERAAEIIRSYYEELKGLWPSNEGHPEPVVYVHPSEAGFIDTKEFEIRTTEDVYRGVVFATPDGRVRLLNTVRTRIERARKALLPRLDRILFADKET